MSSEEEEAGLSAAEKSGSGAEGDDAAEDDEPVAAAAEVKKKKKDKKKKKKKKKKTRKSKREAGSDDEEDDDKPVKPAKRKRVESSYILNEAEEESDEDDEDDEDDDDDSGSDDSIINDDVEEEEEDSSEDEKPRKRNRMLEDMDAEEDIAELLADNLGDSALAKMKKQRKRLLVQSDDEDEDATLLTSRKELKESLFEPDPAAAAAAEPAPAAAPTSGINYATAGQELYSSDSDAMSDFIEDDLGEDDEPGQQRAPKQRRRHRKGELTAEMREALEIFGADFDPDMFLDDADEFDEEEGEGAGAGAPRRPKKRAVVFEPSEIEALHLSTKDTQIKRLDVPERFQLWYQKSRANAPSEFDLSFTLDEEASWIYDNGFCARHISRITDPVLAKVYGQHRIPDATVTAIKAVLTLLRWDDRSKQPLKLGDATRQVDVSGPREIPFIAQYRKEDARFPDVLNMHDLWLVQELDRKWELLCTRKKRLVDLLLKLNLGVHEEELVSSVNMASSESQLDDLNDYIRLTFEDEIREVIGKLPRKRDEFFRAKKLGLLRYMEHFGITAAQIAANLEGREVTQPGRVGISPVALAEQFRAESERNQLQSTEQVLQALQRCLAWLIFVEPKARAALRERFNECATITVRPTKMGKSQIEDWHPYARYRYLTCKSVSELANADYLWIKRGEEAGFLKVTIAVPQQSQQRLGQDNSLEELEAWCYEMVLLDEHDDLAEAWNEQRKAAINYALHRLLLPLCEKDLRQKLQSESALYVKEQCANYVRYIANRQGYDKLMVPREEDEFEDQIEEHLQVVAIKLGSKQDRTKSFVAFLNGNGECTDWLSLDGLLIWKKSNREHEKSKRFEDYQALTNFIQSKRPDVLAVCCDSADCRGFVPDLEAELADAQLGSIRVELVDPHIASIYANSSAGRREFPEYDHGLRMAISVGRRLQAPELELSGLFTAEREVLSLPMHPLRDMIPPEELYQTLCQEMITAVNKTGLDINLAVTRPHREHAIQFVAGLGPRKSAALVTSIRSELRGHIVAREQLYSIEGLGPICAHNCAGFLMIEADESPDDEDVLPDQLDTTRVHPESYELAYKISMDALEVMHEGEDEMNLPPRSKAGQAVADVIAEPEKLQELDLEQFAQALVDCKYGGKEQNLLVTLKDIAAELERPFRDMRHEYQGLNDHDKFMCMTGETVQYPPHGEQLTLLAHERTELFFHEPVLDAVTLLPHQLVEGPVSRLDYSSPQSQHVVTYEADESGLHHCETCKTRGLRDELRDAPSCPGRPIGFSVRLGQLRGFVHMRQISDEEVPTPADRVVVGQIVKARVVSINVARLSIDLTCKSSALQKPDPAAFEIWRYDRDYDYAAAEQDDEPEAHQKEKKTLYTKRLIDHPDYKNVTFQEAMKYLKTKKPGSVIVRPSSKSAHHLTLTWKVLDGIVKHIDVREEGKSNAAALGSELHIRDEKFDDLDEILARFIAPMADYVKELSMEKKFGRMTKAELTEKLKAEKAENSSRIPYGVVPEPDKPGHFLLGYLPHRPKFEPITVTPDGYKFRFKVFAKPGELLNWFKRHWKDPVVEPSSHRQSRRAHSQQQPSSSQPPQQPYPHAAYPPPPPGGQSWGYQQQQQPPWGQGFYQGAYPPGPPGPPPGPPPGDPYHQRR